MDGNMIRLPRLNTPANYYETENWKEDRAARMGVKYANWVEVDAARVNVKWIGNILFDGRGIEACTLASLAYVAGIRAGIHRERQRRNRGARR